MDPTVTVDAPSEIWQQARNELDGLPRGRRLHIAPEAVDRHLGTEREHRAAIRRLGRQGAQDEVTYRDLSFVGRSDDVITSAGHLIGPFEVEEVLLSHAPRRLGPAVAPRMIEVDQDLPETRSGQIMRRLLEARELGIDEGGTSTLEVTR